MKETGQRIKLFDWSIQLNASPETLWPLVSDTNQIFRLLKAPSVKQTQLTRSAPKEFIEVTNSNLSSYSHWELEHYFWERPFRFGTTWYYKAGLIKYLKFQVDLNYNSEGTNLNTRVWIKSSKRYLLFFASMYMERILKQRYTRILKDYEKCANQHLFRYEINNYKPLVRGAESRIKQITEILIKETKRKRIINHLVQFICKADDEDLINIHPFHLAEYWGEKKYSVLNVFLHAAKHNLLDFNWNVCCPNCKSEINRAFKLKEIRNSYFCENCESYYDLDFNTNTHMVFTPHPLIRKISQEKYSFGEPSATSHIISQHYLKINESKYLNVKLEEGTYVLRKQDSEGHILIHAREDAHNTFTVIIKDEDFNNQEMEVSTYPNITLINKSIRKQVCFIEKKDWKQEATYASEIGSAQEFRTLFPREVIKEGTSVNARGVTILFTDLMNSTELYRTEGDEFAIGRVMNHFKIIQQIIAEERGGIVKTIGDSVMAVFREPVSSLKAIERIQQIFTGSSGIGNAFKIKAGIHFGDCKAVNLNDRTDYFGNTVNIAARLVDIAKEKEIIISEEVFSHPDVKLYLDKNKKTLFVKENQLGLGLPPLRLVI